MTSRIAATLIAALVLLPIGPAGCGCAAAAAPAASTPDDRSAGKGGR